MDMWKPKLLKTETGHEIEKTNLEGEYNLTQAGIGVFEYNPITHRIMPLKNILKNMSDYPQEGIVQLIPTRRYFGSETGDVLQRGYYYSDNLSESETRSDIFSVHSKLNGFCSFDDIIDYFSSHNNRVPATFKTTGRTKYEGNLVFSITEVSFDGKIAPGVPYSSILFTFNNWLALGRPMKLQVNTSIDLKVK